MPVQPLPCGPAGGGESPGEPAVSCCSPSITSTSLCRPDGSPVLLMVRSPCVCGPTPPADPEVVGWIDPASGVFTAGPAPAGSGPCTQAGGCGSVAVVELCDVHPDGTITRFLRHLIHDCGGTVTGTTDTATDGRTAYTPTGEVGECPECEPVPMCPQLLGITGPEMWTVPAGTESLAVSVTCGPVTITDCSGNATVINECGATFNWAATGTRCEPGQLCGPVTVDVAEGATVYVQWLSPCGGDES
ncbi:hypothetical protein OG896_24550 [Streptomyces sp. NBC_00669]|uniref:hypothetical protein n=1 Tax=Streptomyces sp. NBC_00669 TaxID=2976011 RepID=UPI002E2FCD13|nr:hypothetical protein [Streptomyces sp. NBC_00669]